MGKLEELNIVNQRLSLYDTINNRLKKRIEIKDSTINVYKNLDSLNRITISNHIVIENIKDIQITSLVSDLNKSATTNKRLKILAVALVILGGIFAF